MEEAPRQGLGSFFRALTDFLDERGLREQVRAAVSPVTQFHSFAAHRRAGECAAEHRRRQACVDCGVACARPLGWSLLQPVLRMVFQLFGQSPEPVFANLDRFFSLVTRGISFSWEREPAERRGTVLARFAGEDTPEAAFHVLRGTLLFAFEVSSTSGEVGAPEVVESTASATIVRFQVQWR